MPTPLMKLSLTAGVLGFVAYCVYFDRKRRSDPKFKEKLKEKRLKEKKSSKSKTESDIPLFKDPAEMQGFFLKEVQTSDDLMQNGKFEEAAFHLANAAVVCSQKSEFLGVMQKSLPPDVFQLLIYYYKLAEENYMKKIFQDQTLNNLAKLQSSVNKQQFIDDTDIE